MFVCPIHVFSEDRWGPIFITVAFALGEFGPEYQLIMIWARLGMKV